MQKVVIICGPTATGKTKLALSLAQKFGGELVNADSRQVYKGLDALTGKERSDDVPIWLYDVADYEFSAAHFVRLAEEAIADIGMRKKLPIVAGGTGFYLHALTQPFETIAIPPDWPQRRRLEDLSVDALQKLVDPKRMEQMNESDKKNPRRLIRAIETAGNASSQSTPTYDALWIGLTAPLPILKQRITRRIAKRFDGAIREVRDGLPPILGKEPLLSFKRGEVTEDEARIAWINAEYQYARRQMTWFRKEKDVLWFDVSDPGSTNAVFDRVKSWYTKSHDVKD